MKCLIEEWRGVPGWEGLYLVSNKGRFKNALTGRLRKTKIMKNGYVQITFSLKGKLSSYRAHRLVAIAFLGEPPEGRNTVNHIDGDKTNNRVSNLEWVSQSQNMIHSCQKLGKGVGEGNPASLLKEYQVVWIRRLLEEGFHSQREIAEMFGVSRSTVCDIKAGRIWISL